jgi:hypothetical protein
MENAYRWSLLQVVSTGVGSGEWGKREKRSHFIFPTPYSLFNYKAFQS